MLSGYETCELYVSLKLHFAPGAYNFFKYHGKINWLTPQKFERRNDRFFFQKLGKLYPDRDQCIFFLAANFFVRDVVWVRDLLEEESKQIYLERLRIRESLMYLVNQDIELTLMDPDGVMNTETIKSSLKVVDGGHPSLLTATMQGYIHKETLIALNAAIQFFPMWEKKITDTILFPAFMKKCLAYQPFLNLDVKEFQKTLKLKLTNT